MTNIQIDIITSRKLRRLKSWGSDQIMIADNYSVTKRLVNGGVMGQFSLVNLYMLDSNGNWAGTWSANELYTSLISVDVARIGALQTPDEYTVDQKMNWLFFGGRDIWGAPLAGYYEKDWRQASNPRMIGAVYAGNSVEVFEERVFHDVFFNGRTESEIVMSRIRTGWEVIQEVTAVDDLDRPILPKGRIILPILTRHASCWVMNRWLM